MIIDCVGHPLSAMLHALRVAPNYQLRGAVVLDALRAAINIYQVSGTIIAYGLVVLHVIGVANCSTR